MLPVSLDCLVLIAPSDISHLINDGAFGYLYHLINGGAFGYLYHLINGSAFGYLYHLINGSAFGYLYHLINGGIFLSKNRYSKILVVNLRQSDVFPVLVVI